MKIILLTASFLLKLSSIDAKKALVIIIYQAL